MFAGMYSDKFRKICDDSLVISAGEAEKHAFTEPEAFIRFVIPKGRKKVLKCADGN